LGCGAEHLGSAGAGARIGAGRDRRRVLAETDGETPFGEIVARLAVKYNAPPEQIATDARRFLTELIERRMAEALA